MLGDGKTWNGLIGGSLTSGLLCMLMVVATSDGANAGVLSESSSVFASPLAGSGDAWFSIGGSMPTAFILGSFLGFM